MIIKDRVALKSMIVDGVVPTKKDFFDLIDSVLVKRDDKFFGLWRNDISYNPDDVVLFNNTLYVYMSAEDAKIENPDCDCDDNTDDCCGNNNPDQCCRWRQIHLDMDDGDWVVAGDGQTMYARVCGKTGIGTGVPGAFFHLYDADHQAQLLFDPLDEQSGNLPMLKLAKSLMVSEEEKKCDNPAPQPGVFVSQSIESLVSTDGSEYQTTFQTDTLGYLFKRIVPEETEMGDAKKAKAGESQATSFNSELALMLITSSPERPRVGIGTTSPKAALDVNDPDKGQILLNPGERKDPEVILLKFNPTNEQNSQNYLAARISARRATLMTDAPKGFAFRKGAEYENYGTAEGEKDEETFMVIDGKGQVGIGAAEPQARLEVSDERQTGSFKFSLDMTSNPSLNIINLRPQNYPTGNKPMSPNYLAFGTDDRRGIISTDSKEGLTFKKGKDLTDQSDNIGIERGKDILSLRTDDTDDPQLFSALLNGYLRAKGTYLEPVPENTDNDKDIKSALTLLNYLKPRVYKDDGADHFGFLVANVRQTLPNSCKVFPDQKEAIGYHDLVVLLVKAVQELSDELNKIKKQFKISD